MSKKKYLKTLTKKMDKKNEEFTKKLLSDEEKLMNLSPYETSDYIKCKGRMIEEFEGKIRVSFVRCPKCRKFISIHKDEIGREGFTKIRKCLCGVKTSFILKKWKTKT